ncbi:MAG: hypothetical protein NTW93_04125 [Phycisphaerae bacterium]|nr:hypothetical protein [Phycisphaerae bacterium]
MKNTNEKPLKYSLTIDTPSGRCQIATESWQLLIELLDPFASTDTHQNMHNLAKRAQIAYHKSYKRANYVSPIVHKDGLEIQVIICYLRGWNVYNTVDWLFHKKKHKASKSAIGRYWTRLRKIGILPVHNSGRNDKGKDKV